MKKKIAFYTKLLKLNVLLRLIFPLLIFISAPAVTIISVILDAFDGEIFKRSGYARPEYSLYDKILDYWWYIWILFYILYIDIPLKGLFIFLFCYRSIGQILFLIFKKGYLLLFFPNIFEYLFFYYLVAKIFNRESVLMNGLYLILALTIISIFKFIQETIVHVKQINFSGVYLGKTTYWPSVTTNPYKIFLFLSLILSLGFVLDQFITYKRTESITVRARRAVRNGEIIAYDQTGILIGTLTQPDNVSDVRLLDMDNNDKVICHTSGLTLLKTPLQKNSVVYSFAYRDLCLKSLPDGDYGLLISGKDMSEAEILIDFMLKQGALQK